jgi:PAS domain S-box-containing protein
MRTTSNEDILISAERALGKRLLPSALVHIAFFSIAAASTPLLNDHPAMTFSIGGAMMAASLLRAHLGLSIEGYYLRRRGLWRKLFVFATVITASCWGGLTFFALRSYDATDFTNVLLLLTITGISTGALFSLVSVPWLGRLFVALTWGFPLVAVALKHPAHSLPLGSVILASLVFLLHQSRVQAEENRESRENAHRFQALSEVSGEGIVIHDAGAVLEVNNTFLRMTGYRREDLLGQPVFKCCAPESIEEVRRQIASGQASQYEIVIQRKDGSKFAAAMDIRETIYHGKPARVGCARDITAQKQTEEALRSSLAAADRAAQAKGRFLATMSHEIRTPLNGILGMAELLAETSLTADQRHFTQLIQESGTNLLAVVQDVLDFSKLDAGRVKLESVLFDLEQTVRTPVELFEPKARAQGLSLTFELDPRIPSPLKGAPARIGQVLLNLISNAVKFTPAGEVRVRVRPDAISASEMTLRFEIQDTGIGIAPTDQERLFQPFTQADDSMTRKYGGSGLGLSICSRLVRMMGGEIGVQSRLGLGSIFWFTIKVHCAEEATSLISPSLVKCVAKGPAKRVLVVEDNAVNQLLTTMLVQNLGFETNAVANGAQAVEAVRDGSYDLVLMDCQMPEMDGFEATRIIRDSELPQGRRIPIIALTANALLTDEQRCLACGMDAFVAKPVKRERLEEILTTWL